MRVLLNLRFCLPGVFLFIQMVTIPLSAQSWEFVKEQDGIKVYTRNEAGKSLKSYKGIANIQAPPEKVFAMLEDVNHTEWWDSNITQFKVLAYEKNKRAQYYLVYDSPWPVTDRDLFVDATVTIDRVKRVYTVTAVPLVKDNPEYNERVRIKDYRQSWIVTLAGENSSHVVVEGYADPVGNIPVWLSNLLINQTPINAILGVRSQIH